MQELARSLLVMMRAVFLNVTLVVILLKKIFVNIHARRRRCYCLPFSYLQLLLVTGTDLSIEDVLTHIHGSSVESIPHTSTENSTAIVHKTVEELLTFSEGKLQREASEIVSQ